MRAEPVCSLVRAELSARMDGAVDASMSEKLDIHLASCARCRAFEDGQHALRRVLRLAPAGDVPDVAPQVMRTILGGVARDRRELRLKLASVAAIAAALVVLASSLPVLESQPQVANASEITRRAFSAARVLDAYRASFDITERTWHPDIPVRRFEADIWYRAPERLRLRVRDLTDHPAGAWPTNDVDLIAQPARSWIREPYSCPPQALPGCAIEAGVEERTVVSRQPFDGTSTAPTEIVLPLETLATSDAFTVAGTEKIDGRAVFHIVLTYRQAFPLIHALQVGGSWAPLLPLDRVDLWIERDAWFPLRFEVTRPGLELPVLEVEVSSFRRPAAFRGDLFDAPVRGVIRRGGFVARDIDLPDWATPADLAGLQPYRSGTTDGAKVVTFADGMTFLKIIVGDRSPSTSIDVPAETVELRPGSFGLYRPAEPDTPRRVDVSGRGATIRLESNLRRDQLLEVAASLPLEGLAPRRIQIAGGVVIPVTPERLASVDLAQLPARLPPGYGPLSARLARTSRGIEVTIVYFATESSLEGSEIRLFQSSRVTMLPPSSENLVVVTVNGSVGRWSTERGELEWIDAEGIYRSIAAPSFDLNSVISIAQSLR